MRTNNYAYTQPAAQAQRWAWSHFGTSRLDDCPLLSTKRADVFCDAVETCTINVRSACTRRLLMPAQRCFELARKTAEEAVSCKALSKCEQACWIGSAVTASIVGVMACVVGVTMGVFVGAYRATLARPDGSQARAYLARERDELAREIDEWQLREDAACTAFATQMEFYRDRLPAWLATAVAERGETVPKRVHVVLQYLETQRRKLPQLAGPADVGPFLATVEDILSALERSRAADTASTVEYCADPSDGALQKASVALHELRSLFAPYNEVNCKKLGAIGAMRHI